MLLARWTIAAMTVVALGVRADTAAAASDPALKCRQAIVRGAAKFADGWLAALRKCEDAKRAGKLSPVTHCPSDAAVVAAFAPVDTKLRTTVARACGGKDRRCGGADDVILAAIDWPGTCPDLEGSFCDRPIASCAEVPDCVACLGGLAVSKSLELAYAPFAFVDPKTQKTIARCQHAIATATAALVDKRLAVMARCLLQRLDGKHDALCPVPGDGKAAAALAAARAKAEAKVCKACGGADQRCGGGDDLDPALVGIAAGCPGVGACGGPIASVADLVACLDCTAGVRGECALTGAAPAVADYPPACAVALPTPTPTVTPTPTETPVASPTLTATPQPTPPPVFCPAAGAGTVTTAVTITLVAGAPISAADLILDYPPAGVRLPGVNDDAVVRTRVTDVSAFTSLLAKGSPNNQDSDGDHEPDRVRFTLVSVQGVSGPVLQIVFDRCSGVALTMAADYTCTIVGGKGVGSDGVTAVPATCTLALVHAGT